MDPISFNGYNLLVLLFVLVLQLSLILSFHEGIIGAGHVFPPQTTITLEKAYKTALPDT